MAMSDLPQAAQPPQCTSPGFHKVEFAVDQQGAKSERSLYSSPSCGTTACGYLANALSKMQMCLLHSSKSDNASV
jgi:hypothetical protein